MAGSRGSVSFSYSQYCSSQFGLILLTDIFFQTPFTEQFILKGTSFMINMAEKSQIRLTLDNYSILNPSCYQKKGTCWLAGLGHVHHLVAEYTQQKKSERDARNPKINASDGILIWFTFGHSMLLDGTWDVFGKYSINICWMKWPYH